MKKVRFALNALAFTGVVFYIYFFTVVVIALFVQKTPTLRISFPMIISLGVIVLVGLIPSCRRSWCEPPKPVS